jgi:hypothetical protein
MSPRLGESLNLEGTLLLWEMFPQLSASSFPSATRLATSATTRASDSFTSVPAGGYAFAALATRGLARRRSEQLDNRLTERPARQRH